MKKIILSFFLQFFFFTFSLEAKFHLSILSEKKEFLFIPKLANLISSRTSIDMDQNVFYYHNFGFIYFFFFF